MDDNNSISFIDMLSALQQNIQKEIIECKANDIAKFNKALEFIPEYIKTHNVNTITNFYNVLQLSMQHIDSTIISDFEKSQIVNSIPLRFMLRKLYSELNSELN